MRTNNRPMHIPDSAMAFDYQVGAFSRFEETASMSVAFALSNENKQESHFDKIPGNIDTR